MRLHGGTSASWLVLLTCAALAHGYPNHRMESRYEGNGWFSYRLTIPPHPFAGYDAFANFSSPFPHFLSYGTAPVNWSSGASPGEVGWAMSSGLFPTSMVTYTFFSPKHPHQLAHGIRGPSLRVWIPRAPPSFGHPDCCRRRSGCTCAVCGGRNRWIREQPSIQSPYMARHYDQFVSQLGGRTPWLCVDRPARR